MGDDTIRERSKASERRQVLLCGIETHVCVWQTAAALRREGYSVVEVSNNFQGWYIDDIEVIAEIRLFVHNHNNK